ncbi:MAG: AAA family ATPase, partial [Chitinophagales bacterium]
KLKYIGPFRDTPQRNYRTSEAIYNYVGKSGEYTSNLLKQAHQNQQPLFEKVSNWFTKTMGYNIGIEEINGANLFKVKVYSENDKRGKDLIDVGFGVSQILPIITQLYYDKSKDDYMHRKDDFEFFVIEQPEIHLHPNAQAELANLFVDKIQSTDKKVTLLIETHSEHLVRRLQSLVADPDNNFNREDVAIYYVDMDKEGVSTVKKMEMNESGQFEERWPSGFFDKAYELSKELMRNVSKRAAL